VVDGSGMNADNDVNGSCQDKGNGDARDQVNDGGFDRYYKDVAADGEGDKGDGDERNRKGRGKSDVHMIDGEEITGVQNSHNFRPTSDLSDINMNLGDGSGTNIRICKSTRNCKSCNNLIPTDLISSTVTHRTYNIKNNDPPNYCDCSSSNLIYLLTCNNCCLQYVGQTVQPLRKRMNKHRNDIARAHGSCPYLIKHFNEGPCKGATFLIQMLENLEGNGRTDRGIIDSATSSTRRQKETEWMLKLRTV
jgi:hypothetical protein